jgi:hypothetical protein
MVVGRRQWGGCLMGEIPNMKSIETELERTTRLQRDAADPTASVWVSANAGTGKTHVLTTRVLRLMLAGTAPERILCLTYTKAAAAEMSKRVFDTLAKWVVLPDADLERTLRDQYLDRRPTADELALARTLFTRATETPGGLSVQTIHAFAERLLQRFPLEAGVTPGFTILDEETSRTLRRTPCSAPRRGNGTAISARRWKRLSPMRRMTVSTRFLRKPLGFATGSTRPSASKEVSMPFERCSSATSACAAARRATPSAPRLASCCRTQT